MEDEIVYMTPTPPKAFVVDKIGLVKAASFLQKECHAQALHAGWWHDLETGEKIEKNIGELLCLVHSEVSEAMEGARKNLMDDKLPHRSMLEVELADAVIRIFDMAGGLGLDLGAALAEKQLYNSRREDHQIDNRRKADGKKF